MYGRVTEEGEEQAYALLGSHHMARQGLEVKLDRGFATGSYAVWVEYDQLAARVGFAAARRLAREYCTLLKSQVSQVSQYRPGKIDDLSQSDDPRRQRDLEGTFLSFVIKTDDGRYHDDAMRKDFQRALLRTGQAWDQAQAKRRDQQHGARQDRFREQLAELLEGEAYAHLDGATKERLLSEVPALAFQARGMER
jgi:hypothetical protein